MVVPVTAGLVVDYSSVDMLAAGAFDHQGMSSVVDSSGNGNHLDNTNGYQALFRPNVTPLGGHALEFSNSVFYLRHAEFLDNATSGEVFAVVRSDTAIGIPGFYQLGGDGSNTYYPQRDGNIYDGSFTNSRYSFTNPVNTRDWHIYNVSHDGTTRTTMIDGAAVHTVTTPFVRPIDTSTYRTLWVGNSVMSGQSWFGHIAEFVVFARSLTSSERTTVYQYLRQQYISAPPPPGDPHAACPPLILGTAAPAPLTPQVRYEAPPLSLGAAVSGRLRGVVDTVSALALQLSATVSAGLPVGVPPLTLGADLSGFAPDASVTPISPTDRDTVLISNPQFIIAMNAVEPLTTYTVEVQYADDSDFTTPVSITGEATALDGGAFLTASTAVPATTFWRTRLLLDGQTQTDWSSTLSFTVETDLTPATCEMNWTVGTTTAPIHLWHLEPASAAPGDTVTAYGQGFPDNGHVTFAGTPVAVTRWELVDQDVGSADARTIDGDTIFAEHYEVDFTVPEYTGPGAALAVTT